MQHTTIAPETERTTQVRLSTGVELEVTERGRLDGQPVVFLHGFTDSRYSFEAVARHLPSDIRAILPSQRGHGDSERPSSGYRLTDFAADVAALLDALSIERATIVGHSLGSFIAQRFAIDFPSRVDRLVLTGTGYSTRPEVVADFNVAVQQLTDPIAPDFIREFQEGSVSSPIDRAWMERAIAESGKLPARVWRDVLQELTSSESAGDLRLIATPTLVVWGANDPLWGRVEQDALLRTIAGARLTVFDRSGHSPNWEEPSRFADELVAFIRP